MGSVHIRSRATSKGERRFVVRYRLGGRAFPLVHAGSFSTQREAKIRRDFIAGELAAGRDPADSLLALAARQRERRTLAEWAERYQASRVDYADNSRAALATHLKRILPTFGHRDPETINLDDVQAWISAQDALKPSSVRQYVSTLRKVLDYAEVKPNPASDERLRMPRIARTIQAVPSGSEFAAILSVVTERWRLPLRVLEQTGLRTGELRSLEWRDVDVHRTRFRIRDGKTASARRWVEVPDWLMAEVVALRPREQRHPEQRVFPDVRKGSLYGAMHRARTTLGLPKLSPHTLRHRYISVSLRDGKPITAVAAQVGHSNKSMTLDTYGHWISEDS